MYHCCSQGCCNHPCMCTHVCISAVVCVCFERSHLSIDKHSLCISFKFYTYFSRLLLALCQIAQGNSTSFPTYTCMELTRIQNVSNIPYRLLLNQMGWHCKLYIYFPIADNLTSTVWIEICLLCRALCTLT